MAHRWALGYALDASLPDHSSLPRIRQRLGLPVFARFVEQGVNLCPAGVGWGQHRSFDATKGEVHAAVASLVPRFYAEARAHVADLFAADAAAANALGKTASDSSPARSDQAPRCRRAVGSTGPPPAETEEPRWDLLGERRLDPSRAPSGSYQRTAEQPAVSLVRLLAIVGLRVHHRFQPWIRLLLLKKRRLSALLLRVLYLIAGHADCSLLTMRRYSRTGWWWFG